MSGIYIPGMEMPTSCCECFAFKSNASGQLFCKAKRIAFGKEDAEWLPKCTPSWCPLVPVPPLIHVGYKKGEEAVDNDKTPQMLQKILDSLPENSPLVPYIKDGGDLALVCVFLALLLMPPDNMARIANEMMEEIVPTPTVIPADQKEEQT